MLGHARRAWLGISYHPFTPNLHMHSLAIVDAVFEVQREVFQDGYPAIIISSCLTAQRTTTS